MSAQKIEELLKTEEAIGMLSMTAHYNRANLSKSLAGRANELLSCGARPHSDTFLDEIVSWFWNKIQADKGLKKDVCHDYFRREARRIVARPMANM